MGRLRVKILLAALALIITALSLSAYFLLIQKKTILPPAASPSPSPTFSLITSVSGSIDSITATTLILKDSISQYQPINDRIKDGMIKIDLTLPTQVKIYDSSNSVRVTPSPVKIPTSFSSEEDDRPTYVTSPVLGKITDLVVGNSITVYFKENADKTEQEIMVIK